MIWGDFRRFRRVLVLRGFPQRKEDFLPKFADNYFRTQKAFYFLKAADGTFGLVV